MEGQSKEEYIGSLRRQVSLSMDLYQESKLHMVWRLEILRWNFLFFLFFFFFLFLLNLIYRKSSGFSRGVSKYRGVARYLQNKCIYFALIFFINLNLNFKNIPNISGFKVGNYLIWRVEFNESNKYISKKNETILINLCEQWIFPHLNYR